MLLSATLLALLYVLLVLRLPGVESDALGEIAHCLSFVAVQLGRVLNRDADAQNISKRHHEVFLVLGVASPAKPLPCASSAKQLPSERLASQWARELFQMNARPNAYEHDANHGIWMTTYARLLAGPPELHRKITQADVEAAFAASRAERDVNPMRDIANQSPWKDAPPSDDEVRRFEEQLPDDVEYPGGRPTVPSRVIPEVDRSSRSGEDHELGDRVLGAAAAQTAPSDLRDLTPELTAGERRLTRRRWKDLVDEIDALIEE